MVVKYNVTLFIAVIGLLVSGVSCAAQPKGKDIVNLAKSNYIKSLADYEKQLRYCKDKSDKNRLNREIFKGIKLTQLQLNIAIGLFHFRALDRCEAEKFGVYLIHRGIYKETAKEYNAKFDTDTPAYYDDPMVFGARFYQLRSELTYLSYPKSEREKLENMPELKNMFHLFSAIDN